MARHLSSCSVASYAYNTSSSRHVFVGKGWKESRIILQDNTRGRTDGLREEQTGSVRRLGERQEKKGKKKGGEERKERGSGGKGGGMKTLKKEPL